MATRQGLPRGPGSRVCPGLCSRSWSSSPGGRGWLARRAHPPSRCPLAQVPGRGLRHAWNSPCYGLQAGPGPGSAGRSRVPPASRLSAGLEVEGHRSARPAASALRVWGGGVCGSETPGGAWDAGAPSPEGAGAVRRWDSLEEGGGPATAPLRDPVCCETPVAPLSSQRFQGGVGGLSR